MMSPGTNSLQRPVSGKYIVNLIRDWGLLEPWKIFDGYLIFGCDGPLKLQYSLR
jgi:hypothetical protein